MQYLVIFLLFVIYSYSEAQVIHLGECPTVETISDFDASQYLGLWYENRKYPSIFELNGKCNTAYYSALTDNAVSVNNTLINSLTGSADSIIGNATIDGDPKEGKLVVYFPTAPLPAPYWILDTDYENYSVVWSCSEVSVLNAEAVWILTRERQPSQEVIDKALSVLEEHNISTEPLQETDQTDCE